MVDTNMSDSSDDSAVEDAVVADIPSLSRQKKTPYYVNNVQGMEEKLQDIQLQLDWTERLDITVDPTSGDLRKTDLDPEAEAENDFKREMSFYNQALAGVNNALKKLKKAGIPTKRPDDYFAEMAKSDAHMQKVREKLLSKQSVLERSEKARAIREQKKQGKKIQREVLEQRKKEKQKMINALKKTKKGKMGAAEVKDKLLNEKSQKPSQRDNKSNKKRDFRDSKYGYGGKKKGSKYNTAESSSFSEDKGGNKKSSFKGRTFGKKRSKGGRRRR